MKQQNPLFSLLKSLYVKLLLSFFSASFSSLCTLFSFLLLGAFLAKHFNEPYFINLTNQELLIALAAVGVLGFTSRYLAFLLSHLSSFELEKRLRTKMLQHVNTLSLTNTPSTALFKQSLLTDVKNLHVFVADSIPLFAKALIAPLCSFALLVLLDYRLALVSVSILCCGMLVMHLALKNTKELESAFTKAQADINEAVIEYVQAMPVVRTFDEASSSFRRYELALNAYKNALSAWLRQSGGFAKLGMLILSPFPTLCACLVTALYFLHTQSLSYTHFFLVLFFSTALADALMPLMWLSNFLKKSFASANTINKLLNTPSQELSQEAKSPTSFDICFQKLDFAYKEQRVLQNINLNLEENSTTALVGASGSGKSSLVKLLLRFYDAPKKSIFIGGVAIEEIHPDTLSTLISYVGQESFLFYDTLFSNLCLGKENASEEEVLKVCDLVGLKTFIETLPKGLHTLVCERGLSLSGGQKQRLSLARALLKDAPILILDEATAFLDAKAEQNLFKRLHPYFKHKTVLLIAHRLNLNSFASSVVLLHEGALINTGSHQELKQNSLRYQELWQSFVRAKNFVYKGV